MKSNPQHKNLETIVFGGGCFWCIEAAYSQIRSVVSAISGYAGGNSPAGGENPNYEDILTGKTGHAEVVQVQFDPKTVSFEDLLSVFFKIHDPTTLNRQGADVGSNYRSIILYANEDQKQAAEKYIKKLKSQKTFKQPIVTELKPLKKFWPAEDYHQKYFEKNPEKAYCQINIAPKIDKLRERLTKIMS